MVGYRQVASTSFNNGSSAPQRNGFHISGKPFFSFNGSNFKTQNQRGSDPPRASHMHTNLENGLDNDVKFRMIVRRIGAGLENLGNTCFLNSVLQCLTYTEPLVAYLLSGKHQKSCHIVGFCALCAIQNHVVRALQSTGRIVAPKDLVSNLRRISRNFRSSRQEDAHEYMVHLLESMHKCCLPSGVPYESPSAHEKSLVHNIFGGSLRSQVKCMQCSYGSNKFDPFLDLSLEINNADSLHKALNHFTAPEMLDGGERQYMCQECKQKVRALKQLTIDKAPFVLTIHLKRFGSHISGQKIDKKVQFGPVLNLKPYVSGSNEGELKYTLYGVLVHAGWSTHSGHYYCFVRTSSGIWYSLDDNRVRQVSERTVLEQKAYMLFYVRDGMNFGAGNIASAMQSQKMVQATMPNGSSCSSNAGYRHMSIDKPVNAPQKEKAVAATIGNGLTSTSATSQRFQNKDDGKTVIGVEKEKILATVPQKSSSEKDSEGILQNSSPAKKFRSTDASDALVHKNLPNEHSIEKQLSKEDSLQNPKSIDLSQSSIESKENDSVLKANVQDSTHLRKCTGGEPSADNEMAKIFEPVTSVTSDDKSSKTDLLVSVAKASEGLADTVVDMVQKSSEGLADIVVDMVQKSSCDKGGAPEETMAKESVENNFNVGQPNGAVISADGLLSNAPSHSSHQKLKKKPSKYTFPTMHLGTRILYGASLSLQKRKKHKKVKKVNQKLDAKNLKDEKLGPSTSHATVAVEVRSKISRKRPKCGSKNSSRDHVKLDAKNLKDEKLGPSTSHATAAVENHSKKSRKRTKCGSKKSSSDHVKLDAENLKDEKLGPSTSLATAAVEIHSKKSRKRPKCGSKKSSSDHVKHDGVSAHENLVSELTKRTDLGNTALTGDNQRLKIGEMQQQGVQISHLKDSTITCNGVTDKPIRNVESTADERCNGVELPSSQTVEVHNSIGYVADEWDEEYDRGKRKKVRISKDTFGGPNPFQKIATKAAKLKGKHKHKQYNLANQPFRI